MELLLERFRIASQMGINALHEFAPSSNPSGSQTGDKRLLGPIDISTTGRITLSVDFYARTSDLAATNAFDAHFSVNGGPHPGFEIIGFGARGGHFIPKSTTGVNVLLGHFNGVNNNEPIPLTVGQQLAWDGWHSVEVLIDQSADRYISLTVDGQTQDLSAFQPSRSFDGSQWLRGQIIQHLFGQVTPSDAGGPTTNDDIYWDNITLTVVPEPTSLTLCVAGLMTLLLLRRRS